jgi:hypothetical protein
MRDIIATCQRLISTRVHSDERTVSLWIAGENVSVGHLESLNEVLTEALTWKR